MWKRNTLQSSFSYLTLLKVSQLKKIIRGSHHKVIQENKIHETDVSLWCYISGMDWVGSPGGVKYTVLEKNAIFSQ